MVLLICLICALVVLAIACMKAASDADDAAEVMAQEYSDEYLLAKLMQMRSGDGWADWAVMLVGEVVMNRVESWRFPDTIEAVIYADNPVQFEEIYSREWDELVPGAEFLDLAQRLINGERALGDKTMLFTGSKPEGIGTLVTYYDRTSNKITYFCRG